jgi:hypothetical protein
VSPLRSHTGSSVFLLLSRKRLAACFPHKGKQVREAQVWRKGLQKGFSKVGWPEGALGAPSYAKMAPGQGFPKERASALSFMALHSLEMPSHLQSQIWPSWATSAGGSEALLNPCSTGYFMSTQRGEG